MNVLIGLVAISTLVAAATVPPMPNCGDGTNVGPAYESDLGLVVIDHTDLPPPADGPFVNESTLRFGNVTLSAEGQASLHLENATAPIVCLNNLDAPFVPVRLTIDDTITVVLEGRAATLAIGPVDFDTEATSSDLAYESNESITVRFPSTGLEPETTVAATATGSRTVLAEGTVDAAGALELELPPGRIAVDLRVQPPPTPTPTATPTLTPTAPRPTITVSSRALQFGNVTVGSTTTESITVTNPVASATPLRVLATRLTGRDARSFAVSGGAPFTLTPGASQLIEVEFSPQSSGAKQAQLQIVTNATEGQIDVWLSNTQTRVQVQDVSNETDPSAETVRVDAVNVSPGSELAVNVTRPSLQTRSAHLESIKATLRDGGTVSINVTHSPDPVRQGDPVFAPAGQAPLQYVSIEHSVPESAFAETGFTIRVNKSRIPADADPASVTVHRFANGSWDQQSVAFVGERGNQYVYDVDTDGFSTFVVAGPPTEQTPTGGSGPGLIGIALIVVVLAAGLGLLVLWMRRSQGSPEGDAQAEDEAESDEADHEEDEQSTVKDGETDDGGAEDSG